MTEYDITIKIIIKKDYHVEAEGVFEAEDAALELAIAEHPGADVFITKRR
jgi:hypothetical protein